MKPQLGDTILNRYTLVSSLREEPGIQAWKANDRVLAKDCQLFIITDRSAFAAIDKLAGRIAATRPDRVIPILKYRMESDVLLIVMPVDSGQCLTDYMVDTAKPLSYSAIRSIIGECANVLREVIADTPSGIVITTDTVRVTTSGVQIADAPCATMLADTSATDLRTDGPERYAIRQLAALLYTLLTRTPSQATPTFNLRALEEEQARIAEVSAIPPSFTPKDVPDDEVDSKLPDEHLFGKLSTKVVAIIVALILVVAAAVWAVHAFRSSGDNPADASSNSSEGDWPDINADAVPFGGSKNATNGGATDDSSKSSDATQSESRDSASDKSKKSETADSSSKKTKAKKSGDKDSSAAPQPRHENNTAFTISSANFLSNPGGQSGYAYYMHLDQPQDAYRMVITIRTSGGKGYIRANTTGDPTQGEQVAEFTFAEGGTTEVKFTKAVNTQDLLLWVPSGSLPQNQLYIEKVEVF